jgi:hypothetical protein
MLTKASNDTENTHQQYLLEKEYEIWPEMLSQLSKTNFTGD